MEIRFVSMRKYKMCLVWKYRVKNFITVEKYWEGKICLLYTSPSPRDKRQSRMPSSA